MIVAAFLLLAVNWLAFHDYNEAHTVRDWLTLLASLLVFVQFARVLWRQNIAPRVQILRRRLPVRFARIWSRLQPVSLPLVPA